MKRIKSNLLCLQNCKICTSVFAALLTVLRLRFELILIENDIVMQ